MKKKILFVATEPAPGMIPFASTVINTLTADGRFDVHCLCVCSGRYTYRDLIMAKSNPVFIDYPSSKLLKLIYKFWPFPIIRALREMERMLNPHVVHFLTGDFTMANYLNVYSSHHICYTVHDMHPHEMKLSTASERFIFGLVVSGYRRMRNMAINLTTSSYAQLQELKTLYPNKNIAFTPFPTLVTEAIKRGGIDVEELKGIGRYILFFGGVQEYKGVQLLIDAFNESVIKDTFKLVIAGRGLMLENMNPQIIRINRFMDDCELKVLFECASLVVYPYLSATMSGVLSLAYYFKKSVLLSDIPFFRENGTSACTFFKSGDKRDLTEKLNCLMFGKNKRRNGNNDYDKIYSGKILSDAYYDFYNEIVL